MPSNPFMRKQGGKVKKIFLLAAVAFIALIVSVPANAILITNGSFEEPVVIDHGGDWQLFDSINGWSNANQTEIQSNLLFGPAAAGSQYAELDSNTGDGNEWLAQTFDTVIGQEYELSFAFSPRENVSENILWAGAISYEGGAHWLAFNSYSASGLGLDGTDWTYYTIPFVADFTSSTIAFKDGGADDSYGTFLDDVSVSPVPEPSTMVLIGLGLIGLGVTRKRFIKDNK